MFKKYFFPAVFLILSGCASNGGSSNYLYPNIDPNFVAEDFFPETSVGAYLAARYARKNLDYSSAADYFIKTLEKDPGNLVVLNNIYMLLVYAGRVDEAYPYALQAMSTISYSGTASIVAIVKNIADGDYEKAEKIISTIDDKGYNKFLIPLISSWLKFGEGEYEQAFETLKPLKDIYEYNSIYHFHAGLMKDILEENDAAREHYEVTLNGPGGSSLRAVDVIVSYMLRNKDYDKAQEIFDKYKVNYPDSFMSEKIERHIKNKKAYDRPIYDVKTGVSEALFGVAAILTQGIGLEHSMFFIRLALHLDNDFYLAKLMLGNILELGELYDQANEVYKTIDKSSSIWLSAQIKIAANLNRVEKVDEAIAILENISRENPDNVSIHMEMGDVYRMSEQFSKAITPYSKAINLLEKSNEVTSKYWSIFYARAICYERIKMWDKAEKDLLKALELEINQPYVLNYLAYSWLEQKKNVLKALDMLKMSHIQRPQDGYIADSLGWAYYIFGEYNLSILYLEKASSLEPTNSVIIDHLGDAYWRVGRKNEAVYQWERALMLNSDITKDELEKIRVKLVKGLPDTTDEEKKFITKYQAKNEPKEDQKETTENAEVKEP